MNYKLVLGLIAVVIGFVGYVPYFRDIANNKTKPHAFTWLVWGTLTAIAFVGQITSGAGAGAWVTGFTVLACFAIFLVSLKKGTKDFPLVDWLSLGGAGLALVLWAFTKSPLGAVIIVTVIDLLAFIPTFRKSINHPYDETMFTYTLSGFKFVLGIIALDSFSTITVLYPASLVFSNGAFVLLLMIRRKQMATS